MLKKLFSNLFTAESKARGPEAAEPVAYKGYLIISQPEEQAGQFRVSGWIQYPQTEGHTLEHRFERSDSLPGREACDALMVSKAQRYIDEVGDAMFESDPRQQDSSPQASSPEGS